MSNIFIRSEAMAFCLLITVFLFVFIRKTFDCINREHNLIYVLSIGGALFSFLNTIVRYEQTIVLSACCYAFSAFFLCKYIFIKNKPGSKKILFMILSGAICVLVFFSSMCGTDAITYLMTFGILILFAVEQFNKIRVDKLTGLFNRYGLELELRKQLWQYKRENTDSFYVIACDLDKFKLINDKCGHLEGDRALKLVADTLSTVCKRYNSNAFRLGGDEFAIITDTSEEGLALEITDDIKKEFDNIKFRDDFDLNISIGNALYDGVIAINELLGSADKKLYEAKRNNFNY